jgi:hypothetical protein
MPGLSSILFELAPKMIMSLMFWWLPVPPKVKTLQVSRSYR